MIIGSTIQYYKTPIFTVAQTTTKLMRMEQRSVAFYVNVIRPYCLVRPLAVRLLVWAFLWSYRIAHALAPW